MTQGERMQKATAHLERAFAISEAELGFGGALRDTRLWLKGKVGKHMLPPTKRVQREAPNERFKAVLKEHANGHEGRYAGDFVTESRDPEYIEALKERKKQQEEHDRKYLEEMAQNQKADYYPRSGRDLYGPQETELRRQKPPIAVEGGISGKYGY